MARIRPLLWLVALISFTVSSFGTLSIAHAAKAVDQATSADCPEHAPPPEPCPAQGTAKHAAGDCCPLMTGSLALLPAAPGGEAAMAFDAFATWRAPSLAGRLFAKDPPPPRV
jgi:hypothetical protein